MLMTSRRSRVYLTARRDGLRTTSAIFLCLITPSAFAQSPTPAGVAAQAQAAFFAASAADIAKLSAGTEAWTKSSNPQELYARAYVQFRALQLAVAAKNTDAAKAAGDSCVASLDLAIAQGFRSAEPYALQSACYGYMAGLGGFAAIRNGSRSGKSIEAAVVLAAANPRVLLVDGFGLYYRPRFVGGDKLKGCERMRAATAAFDAQAPAAAAQAGIANWGAPEAALWAGRCLLDAGDAAAARKAFEHALALAPDFAAAKRRVAR